MCPQRKIVLAAAALASISSLTPSLRAQTPASWLNAVSGQWTDPSLWSSNPFYPANGNPAGSTWAATILPVGNNYTITLGPSIALDSLTIGSPSATLVQNGGTLAVTNNTNIAGIYQLNGGTFSGRGLKIDGEMDWNGGVMTGNGTTTISSGASLMIGTGTSSNYTSLTNRTIENYGLLSIRSGSLTLNNGTLINMKGGVIDLDRNYAYPAIYYGSTAPAVINYGRINVGSIATGSMPGIQALLVNGGTINVRTFLCIGSLTHNGGSVLSGPGVITFYGAQTLAGGTTTFAGANMCLSSYGITGNGNLDLSGALTWSGGGTIAGGGTMQVLPGGVLNVGTGSTVNAPVYRPLNNSGVININAYATMAMSGAPLVNQTGGTINVAPGGSLSYGTTPPATFTNLGTIIYNLNGGTANLGGTGAAGYTANAGTIIANNGTFQLTNAMHQAGSTIAGTALIDLGSTIYYGNHFLQGATTLAGTNMTFGAGTLGGGPGDLNLTGTLNWNGGTISSATPGGGSAALVNIAPDGVLNIGSASYATGYHYTDRIVNNRGTINVNYGSLAFVYGGTLNNLPGGVLNINYPGSVANFGTISFYNAGDINLMIGSGILNTWSLLHSNAGTISVDSGTLSFMGAGTFSHYGGATYTGVGSILFTGATHQVLGETTLAGSRMFFGGGAFTGPAELNITGNLSWTGGVMDPYGSGVVTVASGGTLSLGTPTSSRALGRVINNYGLTDFASGTLLLNSGTFNNRTGGVLNISSPENFTGGSFSQLYNGGTINLADAGVTISVPFLNLGTVNIGTAPLSLRAAAENRGGSFNGPVDNGSALTLSAGASAAAIDGRGSVAVSPHTNAAADRIRQSSLSIASGGKLRIRASGGNCAVSRLNSLKIDSGGVLDLADNDLVLDYAVAPGPIDYIRQLLSDGRLTTSLASAQNQLGYAEASALGITSFSGQPVDSTALCIKYTWAGDTNLDGQVDVIDLGSLATAWQSSGTWINGDSNYDGLVDVIDLGILATNWQAGVGQPLGPGSLGAKLAAFGLPGANVPEPGAIALAAAAAIALGRRRRAG